MRSKQWCVEDSSFEQQIRTNIQELQKHIRQARDQLQRAPGVRIDKEMTDSFKTSLERGHALEQETEQLFRDWTVHLAGEPTARYKKKFSYEKLQKAFREEIDHFKEAALKIEGRYSSVIVTQCHSVREDRVHSSHEDQSCSLNEEEHCLLAAEENHDVVVCNVDIANRIAVEREEGIKRIQSQVTDVNQIFRDLASIVVEQGQQFDTIERQAASASSNTEQVVREIKKTGDRQRSRADSLCCMMVSSVLVLSIVAYSSIQHMPHLHAHVW
jgi:hypothetical protein